MKPVAGDGGDHVLWWENRRSAVFDVVLAVVSAAEVAVELPYFTERFGVPVWPAALAGVVLGSALVLRRRFPVGLVLLSTALSPISTMAYLMGLVALYSLGAYARDRRTVLGVGAVAVAGNLIVIFVLTVPDVLAGVSRGNTWLVAVAMALMTVGVTVSPTLLGMYVGTRRRLVAGLQERTRALELEQRLMVEQARQRTDRARMEERARIAREMHDVVAHRVSLMVVHAGAIRAVAGRNPRAAEESAELLGEVGRQALNELREILGVLRVSEVPSGEAGGPGVGSSGAPVLADLDGLVAQSRLAGLSVELSVSGESRRLGGELEGTAYRLVQEALTNVHKHAASARTEVSVEYRERELAVSVVNGPPPSSDRPATELPSGGNGLRGMRERVRSLSGEFEALAVDGGGFRVAAVLPA